jgi:hypothetical protein
LAPVIPVGLPSSFTQGNTVKWTVAYSDFPVSEGWTLSYAFVPVDIKNAPRINSTGFTITAGTSDWTVTVPTTESAKFEVGTYRWSAYVTLGGDRYGDKDLGPNGSGVVGVTFDLATEGQDEHLAFAAKMLPIVEAEIEARFGNGTGSAHQQYTIGDRSVSKIPLMELFQIRSAFKSALGIATAGSFGTVIREVHRSARCGRDPLWEGWVGL